MTTPDGLPRRFEAALFDFDETMIDLEAQHDAAHRALCREMRADYDALPESFRFGSGRRIVDDIAEMRAYFGWTRPHEELYDIRHRHFLEVLRTSRLELMQGVERVVLDLGRCGMRLAVTTSAAADAVKEILVRLDLRDAFCLIVGGAEVERGKPDPEAYLVTAARLGLPPGACCVFEDSTVGVAAAKAAGMYCFAVRNPRARQEQDLSAADVTLASLELFDVAWVACSGR